MSILTLNTGNTGTLDYESFLKDKVAFDRRFGFDVDDSDLSEILLPHQRAIVKWAVRGGRRAIFARYGLGKSVMQLEILRLLLTHRLSPIVLSRALVQRRATESAELILAELGIEGTDD